MLSWRNFQYKDKVESGNTSKQRKRTTKKKKTFNGMSDNELKYSYIWLNFRQLLFKMEYEAPSNLLTVWSMNETQKCMKIQKQKGQV